MGKTSGSAAPAAAADTARRIRTPVRLTVDIMAGVYSSLCPASEHSATRIHTLERSRGPPN
jgi:hypothetical protein